MSADTDKMIAELRAGISWRGATIGGSPFDLAKAKAVMARAADRIASMEAENARLEKENGQRKEWQDAIIGLCKAIGSDDMPWGGDKAGWGFIFYFVKHLHTRAKAAEAERDALRAALQTSLVAMKLAAALPGVSDEYDFVPAIEDAARALSGKGDGE